jgi:haloacetate dehalogenase
MFDGFALEYIDVGEAVLRTRIGGSGPPVVLLHGHPRTHATWHRVAPLLAEHHTVICPDLRGYGESSGPPSTPTHEPYSKRAMARDIQLLMRGLGFDRFAVVGHDRGAYVAFRMALDDPATCSHLVVVDAVPILDALERCDARFARAWYHWFFFAQDAPRPENAILADPDAWYDAPGKAKQMGPEAYADFRRAIHDPVVVHAMLEDYRAGLGIDRLHDEQDRLAGRRIVCPTMVVWALQDDLEYLYGDPLVIWRGWVDQPVGRSIDCGHHIAEEAPEELAALVTEHLSREERVDE